FWKLSSLNITIAPMSMDIAHLTVRCRASLDSARPRPCESAPFRTALAAIRSRDCNASAQALEPLADLELLIATQFLELLYLHQSPEGPTDLGALHALIHSRLKPGMVDTLSDLARPWVDLWSRSAGRHFSPDVLAAFGGRAADVILELAAI